MNKCNTYREIDNEIDTDRSSIREKCVKNSSDSGIREACGVFGIYDLGGNAAAPAIYYGLSSLQHRGQESCGIAVCDTKGPKGNIECQKGMGLVSEVFKEADLEELKGNLGVGHVRYSTTGAPALQNAQPLVMNYVKGTLALAHNGNLVNTEELRRELEQTGTVFHTDTDSEVIACCIARERLHTRTVEEAVLKTAGKIRGAYGLVIASPRKLIGVRDPLGLKPLCLGKQGDAFLLASESCALRCVGAEFVRDIRPGEIVSITENGVSSNTELCQQKAAHCVFEYIYFARLDSTIDSVNVCEARKRAGAALAEAYPVEADMVCGVPDSGVPAAWGYAEASGIPFGMAFYKNSYVGRTFIKPTQKEREDSVRMKLSVLESAVRGKRIVLVDDSIVRGTTIANLIRMLKHAGAVSVHVRISSPPFLFPCYYGTDIPSNRQLIASRRSPEDICAMTGADSLGYLKIEDLAFVTGGLPLCQACFDGVYPA